MGKTKGKLIVIDGSDSSGKHTQVEFLKANLEKKGLKAVTIDFPQYGSFFGKMVGSYLNGEFGELKDVDPKLASLLYALDRYSQKEKITKWLDGGYYVITDRYTESNLAYQGLRKDNLVAWIKEMENGQLGIPKADVVIYLYVPVEISRKLMENRPDKGYIKDKRMDIHEKDFEFQKKVVDSYIRLSKELGWIVVNCTKDGKLQSKEDIAKDVFSCVFRNK